TAPSAPDGTRQRRPWRAEPRRLSARRRPNGPETPSLLLRGARQPAVERSELALPEPGQLDQRRAGRSERRWVDPAAVLAPLSLAAQETSPLQNANVLGYGLQSHVEGRRALA